MHCVANAGVFGGRELIDQLRPCGPLIAGDGLEGFGRWLRWRVLEIAARASERFDVLDDVLAVCGARACTVTFPIWVGAVDTNNDRQGHRRLT
jgi:hypothetical protein